MSDHRITPTHLARCAVVYLRQSTELQVRRNVESTRLQYALQERARELGWTRVTVIDTDLGCSASLGAAQREGFDQLLAAVARSEVGIVLSREMSRLSRTDRDWCHLLELCQVFGTLLGDDERIYDVDSMDDQLILGIKGTLSVVEMKVLRRRLHQGTEAKAKRGELFKVLPVGYVLSVEGKVVKDPNQRAREAVEQVFSVFRRVGSIRQTFLWFHGEGIELPVNKFGGGRSVVTWQLPSHSFVGDLLRHPFYAGAYVWGRTETKAVLCEGRVVRRRRRRTGADTWLVFISDHHEGYISMEAFEENQRRMRGNRANFDKGESVGPVRAGRGLLTGLLRCGRCG